MLSQPSDSLQFSLNFSQAFLTQIQELCGLAPTLIQMVPAWIVLALWAPVSEATNRGCRLSGGPGPRRGARTRGCGPTSDVFDPQRAREHEAMMRELVRSRKGVPVHAMGCADEEFRSNRETMLSAVGGKFGFHALELYAPPCLRNDPEFWVAAIFRALQRGKIPDVI